MNDTQLKSLLSLVWHYRLFRQSEQRLVDGSNIEVLHSGHVTPSCPTEQGADFTSAEICFKDPERPLVLHGSIKIDARSSHWRAQKSMSLPQFDNVILHVVAQQDVVLVRSGRAVPTLVLDLSDNLTSVYNALLSGGKECPTLLGGMDSIYKQQILSRVMTDRLYRKSSEVLDIYHSVGDDWHETAYICMLRSMGMRQVKGWYEALARSVPLRHIRSCSSNARHVEALLAGQAGMLDVVSPDRDLREQQDVYIALRRDFRLVPMVVDAPRPPSRPTSQIARAARLLCYVGGDLFDRVIEASTSLAKLRDLLRTMPTDEAAKTHALPGGVPRPEKIDLQIINFVIPLLVAYGQTLDSDDALKDRAIDLYENIPPEYNTYIKRWADGGTVPANAFDSQAIIQLATEYCPTGRCAECPLGAMQMVRTMRQSQDEPQPQPED